MPASRKNESTERAGVYTVGKIVESQLDWIFREQPVCDWGIDAHAEIFDSTTGPAGRLLALQIKSGASYFDEPTADGFLFRGKTKHLEYWLRHQLSVVLVMHNPDADSTIWQVVTRDTVTVSGDRWKIEVPRGQRFDRSARSELEKIAQGTPYQRRLAGLALAKPWMLLVADGQPVRLEVEEWVNKSSGRGSIRLFVEGVHNAHGEDEGTIADWPFVMFPGQVYQEAIPRLFPWARLEIDEDFYEGPDEDAYDQECGIWDPEDDKYMMHSESFTEWRERQPRFRPYEIASDELARYRFTLELSEIGDAYLRVDDYLESGTVEVPVLPSDG